MADDFVTSFIYILRDPSVGIHSIETEMDLCFDVGKEKGRIEKTVKRIFSDLYDDNVNIEFEDEGRDGLNKKTSGFRSKTYNR